MKTTLSGLRIVLVVAAVLMMGATSVMSAPEKAITSKNAATAPKPVQNKALDFELHNATGYDISGLYLSPSGTDSWGPNILPETLADGGGVKITFSPDAEATEWDMRADWAGGEEEYVYWMGLSLDEINSLTLKYDEESDKTTAEIE